MAREMKNSGVEWIGEIPIDWAVTNIGRLFEVKAGGDAKVDLYSDEKDEEHPYPVYTNTTVSNQVYAYTSLPVFDENTITVTGRGEIGRAFFRKEKYDAIIRLLVLKPKLRLDSRYYTYWIDSVIVFFTNNAAIGQLSAQQILPYKVCFLPYREQQKIADFLDKKCAEIGNAFEKIRVSIEEYKKLKQAVITQAVTKGIKDDREMKDSGIEWNNKIPVEWSSINPKALFRQRKDKAFEGEQQLTASQQYGIMYQSDYMELTGTKVVTVEKDFDILKHVEAGDFVISMRSFQGGLEYSELSGSISSAYVMLVPNLELVYPRFYRWLLKSEVYIRALQSTSNMVRDGQAMRYSNFSQVRLYTVPMEEQEEIARYLDEKCAVIDDLIAKKEQYLFEIESYKKSLIYEYVTGKKEVLQEYNI